MSTAPLVAAVIVTHNSQRYLKETLASIADQSRQADVAIAIDDSSTDETSAILATHNITVHRATTSAQDTTTRIAQNFHQGLRAATKAGADIVILGDHDDIWHRTRIKHQVAILEQQPTTALLASDGFLIDEHGAAVPGTIRSTFPVPDDFTEQPLLSQIAYAMHHSIATGGASAVRPSAITDWTVPAGWLHDRWWSLAALRAGRFALDSTPVIDYRLSPDQQVGLDTADQENGTRWITRKLSEATNTTRKAKDLSRLLTPPRSIA